MFPMDEENLSIPRIRPVPLPHVDMNNISESFSRHHPVCDRIRRRYHKKRINLSSKFPPWVQIIGFEIPGNA
jgi:hypothetical protein